MEHLPPKPRGFSDNRAEDRNSASTMAHPRDRDRDHARDRYSPGPPRSGRPPPSDVYVPRDSRDAYTPRRGDREGRDNWEPRRDDRDRDGERHRGRYRGRSHWDGGRARRRGSDRSFNPRDSRGERNVYERSKGDGDLEKGEIHDRDEDRGGRQGGDTYYSSRQRRPGARIYEDVATISYLFNV